MGGISVTHNACAQALIPNVREYWRVFHPGTAMAVRSTAGNTSRRREAIESSGAGSTAVDSAAFRLGQLQKKSFGASCSLDEKTSEPSPEPVK